MQLNFSKWHQSAAKNVVLKKKRNLGLVNSLELVVLAVPGIIWLIIFCYLPMGGLIIAFKDFNYRDGILGSPWVGLQNFQYLFQSMDAYRIIRNTFLYNLMFIIVGTIVAVLVALLLDSLRSKMHLKIFQTCYFLPYFLSWVVVGFISSILLNHESGVFNTIRTWFGMERIAWYQEPEHWWWILLITYVWKQIGFQSVIYFGSITSIPQEQFEAAEIDGCNAMQKIWYITLPMLKAVITILTIMAIGNIMRADFGLFYYIPNNMGALYETTDVIDTYIFRSLTVTGNISASSAIGFFQSVVGLVLVLATNAAARKIDSSTALF